MQKYVNELKGYIIPIIAVTLAIVIAILTLATPFIASAVKRKTGKVVVIDAGHGGFDGGVVGIKSGVKESDINLSVAKLLGEYLKVGGYEIVQTRTNDIALSIIGISSKKKSDMFRRGQIINACNPSAVVSIHMNFYSASARRGAQVFFNKKNLSSECFGKTLQEHINRDINSVGGGREYSALSAEKYILQCTSAPVVIVECGFLSNPIDEANLINPNYQARLAYVIFQAVTEFLSEKI